MVKVGWMVDPGFPRAGMILSVEAFARDAPSNYELVPCHPDKRPPNGIDAFVCHGDLFGKRWIDVLRDKPLLAHRHGAWHLGDPIFRRWVLENATLVTFNSPKQLSLFPYTIDAPCEFIPLPIDMDRFKVVDNGARRLGAIYLGILTPSKGVATAVDWALRGDHALDFYGMAPYAQVVDEIVPPCKYYGSIDYEDVPDTLARYDKFVFMPYDGDLYARTVIEAIAAGCTLVLQGDEQAFLDWFDPDACQGATQLFWEKVGGILDGIGS